MPRRILYKTADNLLDRCTVHNDCYVWPDSSSEVPVLGPDSPMSQKFRTTSVVRILFILCKYIPEGRRLVRKCPTHFCVNPFHFTESKKHMSKRAKLPDPNGLTLEQMLAREKIAPPEEELDKMRPSNPIHVKRLMNSAVIAGYDGEGMEVNDKRYKPPKKKAPRMADAGKPVLVIKGFDPEAHLARQEPAKKLTDEEWDEIENSFKKKDSLPEIRDETEDLDDNNGEIDIFQAIKLRKEWEAKK